MIGLLLGMIAGELLISGLWWLLVIVFVIWAAIHIFSFIGSLLTFLFYGFIVVAGIYLLLFLIGCFIDKDNTNEYVGPEDSNATTLNATENENSDMNYVDAIDEEWTYVEDHSALDDKKDNSIITLNA